MAEDLGVLLHKREKDHAEHLRRIEEDKLQQIMESARKAMLEATKYLDGLREKIPDDAKKSNQWSASRGGLTYVIPTGQLWNIHRKKVLDNGSDYHYEHYLHDENLWIAFVGWAKKHGLSCEIGSESHYETNGGDEMWSEHDYDYILLRPL